MKHECKFCGKIFNAAYFISKKEYTCGECSSFCMKKCAYASTHLASWHKEPCVSCELNPYKLRHTWNGERWVKND